MENPFRIFPQELWLMIIQNADLLEVQLLFHAIPQFFTTFNKSFCILHYTYKSNQFFKQSCSSFQSDTAQLISRRWCSAVYNFVTKYPFHVSQPIPEFRYLINLNETLPNLHFEDANSIKSFNNISNLPTVRFTCGDQQEDSQRETFKACVELFETYGSSLKIVTLNFPNLRVSFSDNAFETCALPRECLGNLKNVHTLSVNLLSIEYFPQDLPIPSDFFPELPCLRNLEIYDNTNNAWENRYGVVGFFIRGYVIKGQVKRLRVKSDQPLLTCEEEFVLDNCGRAPTDISEFRRYIRGHHLKQVTIKQKEGLVLSSALLWLQMEGMNPTEVSIEKCPELTTRGNEQIPGMPAVKYLKITDFWFLQYRFLSDWTSLEHLCVECVNDDHVNKRDRDLRLSDDFTRIISWYLYNDVVEPEVDVWSILPSLKSFLVLGKDDTCKHFIRGFGNKPVVYSK